MVTKYQSSRDTKTLVIERTDDGRLRLIITLRKLGVVTMLDYFISSEEAEGIVIALEAP